MTRAGPAGAGTGLAAGAGADSRASTWRACRGQAVFPARLAWLPAVVMVRASPVALIMSRKVSRGYCVQIPLAATVLPSEVARAIGLRVTSPMRTSASPYQDCRSPRSCRPGVATAAGNPSAAWPNASRIWPRRPAQYRSYFDVTPPVCPDDHGTRQSRQIAECVNGWPDVPGGHRYHYLPQVRRTWLTIRQAPHACWRGEFGGSCGFPDLAGRGYPRSLPRRGTFWAARPRLRRRGARLATSADRWRGST